MKLRNHKSFITALPEGRPPKNIKPRFTQWLYFLFLVSVVAYLGYIVMQRLLHYEGRGQIEVEKTILSSSRGGKILELAVREGQVLKAGDLIARIAAVRRCGQESDERLEKLRYKIELNTSRLKLFRLRLSAMNEEGKHLMIRRALEADRSRTGRSSDIERERQRLVSDVALLAKEVELQQKQLGELEARSRQAVLPDECQDELIVSPFPARVQVVKRRSNEFAVRGKPLVTLVSAQAPVRAEAYFDKKELEYISVNKEVDLDFPDGWQSRGRVQAVYSSAYVSPEREWDGYLPRENQVLAYVIPMSEEDRARWLTYDRMDVRVRGAK